MRLATVLHHGRVAFGPVVGHMLHDVSGAFTDLAEAIALDHVARLHAAMTHAPAVSLDECTFLPPIPRPERILCIGVNYADHRAESQTKSDTPYPTVFSRFPSSVVGHQVPIVRPRVSDRFDWEGELAVVIGRAGRYISPDDARSYIAGYTCFMDGSIRDYQRHASQFLPGKTFDDSGACGPYVVTIDEVGADDDLTLTTLVNGVQMQHASTRDLIHDVPQIIAYCSQFTTLEPGDIIATGTPGGVGAARTPPVFLQPGDVVEVVIDRVGTLRNQVVAEA